MEIGFKSGMLTYVEDAEPIRYKCGSLKKMVNCVCDCGNTTIVATSNMSTGKAFSCGCSKTYNNVIHTHIKRSSRGERNTWSKMKSRCLCITDKGYVNYGGRGISICDKWLTYSGFIEDMGA